MSNILESDVLGQMAINIICAFIVIFLHYLVKKLYQQALAPTLSNALKWTRSRIRGNRSKKLKRLKNLRRDPAEVIRLTIKASTYFALFIISAGFYLVIILFLTPEAKLPVTLWGKLLYGSPIFLFEWLWLSSHMDAEDLAKQRRKLFYKIRASEPKGEKSTAS